MKLKPLPILIIALVFLLLGSATAFYLEPNTTEYAEITSETAPESASEAAFHKMMDVLTHQRCMNCHPSDNIPKQGEDSHAHYFDMSRGEDNHGYQATTCNTCHQSANNDYSGVPGAPEWALAPHSMRWEGLNRFEIAESMLDPERNGGRTPEETLHHLTEHELVLWAWTPGVDAEGKARELPPVPKDEYITAVKTWFQGGHIIPSK